MRSGGNANQHRLVERAQRPHNLFGLVQSELKAPGPAFAGLHTGRDIEHEDLPVAAGFGHDEGAVGVEEPANKEEQQQGLSEEQQVRQKAARADLILLNLSPQQQGGHCDTLAPALTQIDKNEDT